MTQRASKRVNQHSHASRHRGFATHCAAIQSVLRVVTREEAGGEEATAADRQPYEGDARLRLRRGADALRYRHSTP